MVDYVKFIIKNKKKKNKIKFKALLFLKELMKLRNKKIVDYVDYKILDRFFIFATTKSGESCLLVYNKKSNKKYSRKFY